MRKLNKSEIQAIATKIKRDLDEENQVKLAERREKWYEEFYQTDIGKLIKELQKMCPDIINRYQVENVRFKFPVGKNISVLDIERELIINQIEVDNLDDLISSVKKTFLVK